MATNATESADRKTTTKAKLVMIRRQRHISFQETVQAASYNRGGRKIKNMSSGSIFITGTPGIKLMASPANTNKIG
ncbi:hypothetical protein D3C87_1133900 [compost metagenome]